VQNSLGTINLVLASGRIGKPKCGYGTIVGQANGQGGREHGQKCDQLPGWRDISNPEHRRYIAGVWGIDEKELPGPGVDAYELFRKIDRGEIKGLLSICFNPKVSLPDNTFVAPCLDKLEFYAAIDFFLNDTAWHADIVLPGSLHEEDEGTVTQVEGRVYDVNCDSSDFIDGERAGHWTFLARHGHLTKWRHVTLLLRAATVVEDRLPSAPNLPAFIRPTAFSRRSRDTNWCGGTPTVARKRRAKWNGLMRARCARVISDTSFSSCDAMHSKTERS
jgi:Molybdopterin oxidoreductase